jgi:hypothetical protein
VLKSESTKGGDLATLLEDENIDRGRRKARWRLHDEIRMANCNCKIRKYIPAILY